MARVKLSSLCCGWIGPSGLPCGLKSLYKCTAAAAAVCVCSLYSVVVGWAFEFRRAVGGFEGWMMPAKKPRALNLERTTIQLQVTYWVRDGRTQRWLVHSALYTNRKQSSISLVTSLFSICRSICNCIEETRTVDSTVHLALTVIAVAYRPTSLSSKRVKHLKKCLHSRRPSHWPDWGWGSFWWWWASILGQSIRTYVQTQRTDGSRRVGCKPSREGAGARRNELIKRCERQPSVEVSFVVDGFSSEETSSPFSFFFSLSLSLLLLLFLLSIVILLLRGWLGTTPTTDLIIPAVKKLYQSGSFFISPFRTLNLSLSFSFIPYSSLRSLYILFSLLLLLLLVVVRRPVTRVVVSLRAHVIPSFDDVPRHRTRRMPT
jgi:hypothetical protein